MGEPLEAFTIRIEPIAPDAYAREVLPDTFALWGAKRSFERYVEDHVAQATSAYGKRRPFTVGLHECGAIVASCKNYEREIRWGTKSLRATGIGAVFTPGFARGRGYATVMLAALLDAERASGRDLAYLYSDIHPIFYERLGFIALPSRAFSFRAQALDGSHAGAVPLESGDWPAVQRCFERVDRARPWSFRRTRLVWDWMRTRWNAPAIDGTQPVQLVVRRGRSVSAYVIGRRALRQDTFVIDDFGFDGDDGRARLPALLRAATGDLRRIGGWLPPAIAREALPRGTVRARKDAMLMVAPLSPLARLWWAEFQSATLSARSDSSWSADHV